MPVSALSSPIHPSPTALYPLSLHDALPIYPIAAVGFVDLLQVRRPRGVLRQHVGGQFFVGRAERPAKFLFVRVLRAAIRSEEHTSELQSLTNLVCRLLLEKKNQNKEQYDEK